MLFTRHEAEAKLNKTVRTRMALVGIPLGTAGKIVQIEETADGCAVIVAWDLPTPRRNRFSKDLYELYVTEEP
jgi:hypothetical protein